MSGAGGLNTAAALSQDGSGVGSVVGFSVSEQGLDHRHVLERPQPGARSDRAGDVRQPERSGEGRRRRCTARRSTPGAAQIGVAGQGGRGTLSGGTLEMSNVDLAAEFTNLIVAERGFQANSRVITTSDQILQDLVNLKQ